MKKALILLAALAFAAPAFGAAGIDLSANHICPGIAGGASDGGVLDCAALAGAGKLVSIYCSFQTAENITDLSNLDGTVHVSIVGDWATTGAFWDGSPGACLDANGGSVKFVGSKPVNGDACGSSLTMKECFPDGAALTTVKNDANDMDLFFSVYKAGSSNITTANRLFGFEIRYDPAYSTEGGFTCGTCTTPICWTAVEGRPGSFAGNPTTNLHGGTGFANVSNQAGYNGSCAVPTQSKTWGQLKSLYR